MIKLKVMKNRDSRKNKRAERQTEIAGKLPYHRVDKLQKERLKEISEKYSCQKFRKS